MTRIMPSTYRPPFWLRDAHVQSVLSSSALRRRRGELRFQRARAVTTEHWLQTPDGVRLQGFHSSRPDRSGRGLALLLHGWEGCVGSGYMLHTAANLLDAGFDVFRLNFRDHGDTHGANPGIFHSCRLKEIVDATLQVRRLFQPRVMVAAGYSLGGNFALRLARAAPDVGLALARVAAVCPVLDPSAGMDALERAPWMYQWYFLRKWRRSLRKKRALFPGQHDFDDAILARGMRSLTDWLVRNHTDFATLDDYFNGYAVAGDRLAGLQVPASILTASDDPVIPVAGFYDLVLPDCARLEIAEHGGHCGFIMGRDLSGFAEQWVTGQLCPALDWQPAATMDGRMPVTD